MTKPQARSADLVVQQSNDGVLVYDKTNDAVHFLDADVVAVWQLADGTTSLAAIAETSGSTEQDVVTILTRLEALGLMSAVGISRRDVVIRMAAGVAATSVIASIVAPTAAMAGSLVACQTTSCSGTDTNDQKAKAAADAFCSSNPNCQAGSICSGGAYSGSPSSRTYGGPTARCVF